MDFDSADCFLDPRSVVRGFRPARVFNTILHSRQNISSKLHGRPRKRPNNRSSRMYMSPSPTPPPSILLFSNNTNSPFQTKAKFTRIKGAQQNGFENLGFFAAAVVAGNLAGLSSSTLNGLSAGYVVSRVVYTAFYISNTNPKFSDLRSVLWLVGVGQCITLYFKAGWALQGGSKA